MWFLILTLISNSISPGSRRKGEAVGWLPQRRSNKELGLIGIGIIGILSALMACGPTHSGRMATKIEANSTADSVVIDKLEEQTLDDEILFLQRKIEKASADNEYIDQLQTDFESEGPEVSGEPIKIIEYMELDMQIQMLQNQIAESLGKPHFMEIGPQDTLAISKLSFDEANIVYHLLAETFKLTDRRALELTQQIKSKREQKAHKAIEAKDKVLSASKMQSAQAKLLLEMYKYKLISKAQFESEKNKIIKTSEIYKLILDALNKIPEPEIADQPKSI